MWERLKQWVLQWLGIQPPQLPRSPDADVSKYEDITTANVTAIISNKLAMLTLADSTMTVTDANMETMRPRVQLIHDLLDDLFRQDFGWLTAQAFGKGGKVIVPTYSGGKLRLNFADHNRLLIRSTDGHRITAATIVADKAEVGNKLYYLLTDYDLDPLTGLQTIRSRARSDAGSWIPLATVDKWADITPELTVTGTDRLLFAYLRCPRDNRTDDKSLGVPITYGIDRLLEEFTEHVNIYRREYRLTRPMLGLDATLWRNPMDMARPLDINQVKKTVQDEDSPFVPIQGSALSEQNPWQYYAPSIRSEAMEMRYQSLCRRIEKACGLSQGILTERQTLNYANRDEVRAAQYDTFCVIRAMRDAWDSVFHDLAYAIDVLAERFGLTPAGGRDQYEIEFDWDTSLIESSAEAFHQNAELHAAGGLSTAELRQWVRGGTIEEAEEAVEEIAASKPNPLEEILKAPPNGEE